MAKTNNFLEPALTAPRREGQHALAYVPFVRHLAADTPLTLETAINDYLTALATPLDPDNHYFVREIHYSSAQLKNNNIQYSALLHMERWERV